MSDPTSQFNNKLYEILEIIAQEGISNAAAGFSTMLGQELFVTKPEVRLVPVSDVPHILGGPENEAVGIYLRSVGEIPAQIMLIMPYTKALELVDLLMGNEPGETPQLGRLERSALAEVGNLTGTFFMNSVAQRTGIDIRPTPPAVMVDMVGAILDIVVATLGGYTEHILMLQATFSLGDREVEAEYWVIPDQLVLEKFSQGL